MLKNEITLQNALNLDEKVVRNLLRKTLPKILRFDGSDLPPLQPDLLGERLLIQLVMKRDKLKKNRNGEFVEPVTADPRKWIRLAMEVKPEDTIETLRLVVNNFAHLPETGIWLEALLEERIEREKNSMTGEDGGPHDL